MQGTGRVVFNALLNKCPPSKKEGLLSHVSKKEKEELKKLTFSLFKDPTTTKGLASAETYLENIHASWMAPFLRNLTESDIRLFAASLSEKKRNELKAILLLSNHFPKIPPQAKQFLQEQLFIRIKEGKAHLLPLECLPDSPLNALLELKYDELLRLIDLAGLYDAAFDLRQVIETSKIKQIYAALPSNDQKFLESIMQEKETIAFKKMGLDKWEGDVGMLKGMIRQRGLNRLAKALFVQEESLFWYVSRKLDTENGAALQKLCTDLKHPQGVALLTRQLTDLIPLIRGKKI